MKRSRACFAVLFLLAAVLGAQTSQTSPAAQTAHDAKVTPILKIAKTDPPNWFVGLPSPVLLLYGEGLAGIQVKTVTPGVKVERFEADGAGHHSFVWLDTKDAHAGTVTLAVTSPQGSVTVPFEIAPRRDGQSGMQGLSVDDAIVRVSFSLLPGSGIARDSDVPTSSGLLNSIAGRLDTFKSFGVTAISTTSISAGGSFAGAASDFYAVDERLGTLRAYQNLVADAHARGMKVMLDLQFNHIDPKHAWVSDPPQPNWLHGTAEHHGTVTATTSPEPITNPHAPAAQRKAVLEGWYDGQFPGLNQQSPRLAQYLIQNALWWIETTGVDGFRLGSFAFVDRSFWHDFDRQVRKLYPRFETVAEVPSPDPAVASFFLGGATRFDEIDSGADAALDSPLSSALQEIVFKRASAAKITGVLRQDWMYPHPEKLITFFHGDRDFWTSDDFPAYQADLAFSVLATMRGIPQFNLEDVQSPIDLRKLLQVRKDHIALRQGKLYDIAADDSVYAYARVYLGSASGFQSVNPENVLVVINSSDQPQKRTLHLADTPLALAQKITEIVPAASAKVVNGNIDLEVAPGSVAIYVVDCGCEL